MSSNNERDSVTFVWTIENLENGWNSDLNSPIFSSNSLDYTEWKLTLFLKENNCISLGLTRCGSKDNDTRSVIVDCKLSIVDENGSSLKWKESLNHGFTKGYSWLCRSFVARSEVFNLRKTDYLPRDTLTVSCRLRKSFNVNTVAEVRFAQTRIEKICFMWTINDFSTIKRDQKKSFHLKKTDSESPFLTFDFVIERNSNAEIHLTSTEYQRLDFLCCISLIDSFGRVFKSKGNWYSFELSISDRDPRTLVWGPKIIKLISFINKGFLCSKKSLYLPMDILSMRVELFYWTGDTDSTNSNIQRIQFCSYQITDETEMNSPRLLNSKDEEKACETDHVKYGHTLDPLSHSRFLCDLQCMYEEGILSDFILRSSGKDFPVHKSILCARSPVFRAMFTTEMREKESDFIEIPDVDADTLHRMLLFVYLNKMEEDMQWESAMNLYFAADKYAIEELKRASRSFLKSRLCASNACEILAYADLHGDQDLKSTAKDFIIDNDSKVIGSEDWNKMLKSNIHLTVEIFSELYMKKMKNK